VVFALQQRLDDVQLHRELPDLALRLTQGNILNRQRAGLQPFTASHKELLTPAADPPGGLAALTCQQIQGLATQQAHHDPLLAPGAPAHFALAYGSLLRALDILRRSIHTRLRDSRHADLLGLNECPVRTGSEGRGGPPPDWARHSSEAIPGYYATVREDTEEVLGIVGERYRIVQNHEAFSFIDQLLGSAINFETAGTLHGGRRVWVLATLPEHVEVGGDPVRPYVLLMNSHDGSTAVVAATTPIRVVCQNTLNWGLQNARQKFSIRHTEAVTQRVHEARRVLDLSINYYEQFKRFGDHLASERCTERQLQAVLEELYPNGTGDSISARTRRSRQHTKDRIAELFLRGDTQGNAPGSKWAAVNAIVEYGDWLRPLRSGSQRFARVLDDGAEKTRALQLVATA
jgi:phage/plasmid-like protein (TIGR03299 family)